MSYRITYAGPRWFYWGIPRGNYRIRISGLRRLLRRRRRYYYSYRVSSPMSFVSFSLTLFLYFNLSYNLIIS